MSSNTSGKIYITISDARTGEVIKGTNVDVPKSPKLKAEKDEPNSFGFVRHQFFNSIEREAKTMVNYTLGNIGNFTGDYMKQTDVNFAVSAANIITNLGMSALAGLHFGPIGAAASVLASATAQAINFSLQLKSQNVETRKQNYSISQLRQLSGLDGLTNGSRI